MFIFISGTQQTKKKILLYTIVHVCALYNGTALSGRVYVHVLFWGNHTIIINSLSWYHRIWYFLYLITWTNFYTHTYLDSTEWMRYCVCVFVTSNSSQHLLPPVSQAVVVFRCAECVPPSKYRFGFDISNAWQIVYTVLYMTAVSQNKYSIIRSVYGFDGLITFSTLFGPCWKCYSCIMKIERHLKKVFHINQCFNPFGKI